MHQRLIKNKYIRWIPVLTCGLLFLAGCNIAPSSGNVPTKAPIQHSEISFTASPEPTSIKEVPVLTKAAPTPTSTPTPAPTATPTPVPTPTGTFGEVRFSEAGYFFTENTFIELSVSSSRKTGYITYTLDGTEPTEADTLYTEPLLLVTTEDVQPNVYSIRAKVWYDDGSVSDTCVHTYFVGKSVDTRYTTVIFSINGDPAELTDEPDGILYGENSKGTGLRTCGTYRSNFRRRHSSVRTARRRQSLRRQFKKTCGQILKAVCPKRIRNR